MAETVHDAASPEIAWQNGVAAAARGDALPALLWLERAARMAPDDPRIALDLANVRLGDKDKKQIALAAAAFELLVARYDVAAAWLGLMAARRLAGEHAKAGEALRALLARHCVPEDSGFAEVALRVARAAGAAGYCGIDATGRLHVVAGDAAFSVYVDHVRVALGHLDLAPGGRLRIWAGNWELLGSPLVPEVMRRVQGMVEDAGAGLLGWASRPAAPEQMPEVFLTDVTGVRRAIAFGAKLPADNAAPLTARYGFECPAVMLAGLVPPFRLCGPDGVDILGSPIDPRAELMTAPVAARFLGVANRVMPDRAGLAVVVPVYRGLAVTRACLTALVAALPADTRLIIVDDASPEPGLVAWLGSFAREHGAYLIRHDRNRGFPAAANVGLAAAAACDVLLLNSDTLVPPGAIETLLDAIYARPETGSATPFSNEASILSYPKCQGGNAVPDLAGAIALNQMAGANQGKTVEIPTGVGFCLMMRHDCLAATGGFRTNLFAQGYGEENDWCLRARQLGFRHVAAVGAYVAHDASTSFGAAGRPLSLRNLRVLERLYPGYRAMVGDFLRDNPLAGARRRFDLARFKAGRKRQSVLLISHNQGGGVQRRVAAEMRDIRAAGARPVLLCPATVNGNFPWPAQLTDDAAGDYPNLQFMMPRDEAPLLRLLKAERIGHAILHHGLGHHAAIRGIAARLGCALDIVVHDYASFCPRVHLVGAEKLYCGEPDLRACRSCVGLAGDATFELLGPERLAERSLREFAGARRITAPSTDTARRIAQHFPGVRVAVTPWGDDSAPVALARPGNGHRRIAVVGGIGIAKGYEVLLACARDAVQRDLGLEFLIAGSSSDDAPLLETGKVFISGAYQAGEAEQVIAGLRADLAFIPSIWPETWCFTLGEAWGAGLYTLAFDLGAQAERIRATQRGGLLPLGLPAPRINDMLLRWQSLQFKVALDADKS